MRGEGGTGLKAVARTRRSRRVLPYQATAFHVGISGFDYPGWRGSFYPEGVPRSRWLAYASHTFNSIELNGTFYSLESPSIFQHWMDVTPTKGFVFAIKGGQFITHNRKLRNCTKELGNFFASGVLALGRKTGPFLWQLPPNLHFDADRMDSFMAMLPRDSRQGEAVAREHDSHLRHGALVHAPLRVAYRHAFEVRHESYFHQEFYDILRRHRCALVIADTAGRFGYAEEITADFVYVRLHGSREMYSSGYTDDELDLWARRIRRWARGSGRGRGSAPPGAARPVYVYFDNDAKKHAPQDALRLMSRLGLAPREDDAVPASRHAEGGRRDR